jgi:hypothetical protein
MPGAHGPGLDPQYGRRSLGELRGRGVELDQAGGEGDGNEHAGQHGAADAKAGQERALPSPEHAITGEIHSHSSVRDDVRLNANPSRSTERRTPSK